MRVIVVLMSAACAILLSADADPPSPPPLSQEQLVRVRGLVQEVQAQATLLQARLDQRQRELADVYTVYELDEPRAQKLQAEIVELQRRLLANHHRMQAELRAIVSRERFEFLRKRLANVVTSPGLDRKAPEPPTHERSTP